MQPDGFQHQRNDDGLVIPDRDVTKCIIGAHRHRFRLPLRSTADGQLEDLLPCSSAIEGNDPPAVPDVQLRGDSFAANPAGGSVFAGYGNLGSAVIQQPISIDGPVEDAVGVFTDSDDRGVSVPAVPEQNGFTAGKSNQPSFCSVRDVGY